MTYKHFSICWRLSKPNGFQSLWGVIAGKFRFLKKNAPTGRSADLGRFLLRLDDCNDGSVATAICQVR